MPSFATHTILMIFFLLYFNFMCHFHTEVLCRRLLKEQNKTKDDECGQEYRLVCQCSVQTAETKLKSHWINWWVTSKVKNEL